jgi:dTDP-4-dehydrorhamnose reductase
VEKVVQDSSPDIILLVAALSHVDYCEEFPEESEKVNIVGLQNIIDSVAPQTIFGYFSSDYVFNGEHGPYAEHEATNPICIYGKHKVLAEEQIQKVFPKHIIVRTTGVYGPEKKKKNFVLSLIDRIRGGEKVKIPFDQIGSPTYSENLAAVVEELVRKEKSGVYNIAGSELLDRYSFAKKVCGIFELPEDMLIPVLTKELGQKARRPLQGGFVLDKVMGDVSVSLMDATQGLEDLKKRMNNN